MRSRLRTSAFTLRGHLKLLKALFLLIALLDPVWQLLALGVVLLNVLFGNLELLLRLSRLSLQLVVISLQLLTSLLAGFFHSLHAIVDTGRRLFESRLRLFKLLQNAAVLAKINLAVSLQELRRSRFPSLRLLTSR